MGIAPCSVCESDVASWRGALHMFTRPLTVMTPDILSVFSWFSGRFNKWNLATGEFLISILDWGLRSRLGKLSILLEHISAGHQTENLLFSQLIGQWVENDDSVTDVFMRFSPWWTLTCFRTFKKPLRSLTCPFYMDVSRTPSQKSNLSCHNEAKVNPCAFIYCLNTKYPMRTIFVQPEAIRYIRLSCYFSVTQLL